MSGVIAAAPSWPATIGMCAVLLSIAAGLFVQCLRDLGETAAGEGDRRTSRPPLPLIIFGGVPVAASTVVLFAGVANRDGRIEGNEAAVLCAGTGAFVLLVAIDLIRSARRHRPTTQH